MDQIWILTASLFITYGDNQIVEQRNFFQLEECIVYAEELVRKYDNEKKGNLTVSCLPRKANDSR